MGVLKRVNPRIRKGLSANAVRLLTGEPAPKVKVHQVEKVYVEPEHHTRSAKKQVNRRLNERARRRTAKRRG